MESTDLFSPDAYPLYFERILRILKMPVWIAGLVFGGVVGSVLVVSDIAAGLPVREHFPVLSAELISIALAPILMVVVRNRALAAYRDLLAILPETQQETLAVLLRKAFDQRRSLILSLIIGAAGVVQHISLSYFTWGRIWWYSTVDILLIGFGWWFVVASFFWTCASVAGYSFYASRCLQLMPRVFSHKRMCGLESFGNLAVVPSVAWGTVATFGTLSTFDPATVEHFAQLIVFYLTLDFIIVAGSMTAIFFLPILGYRSVVLPLKRSLSRRMNELLVSTDGTVISDSWAVDDSTALRNLYLWALSSQIRQIKEWPLSLGGGIRFLLSYVIPGAAFIGRLMLLTMGVQIPL